MKRFILLAALAAFLFGCAATPYSPPPECDAGGSLILERIPDIKALDKGLLTVQVAALETIDGYSAADAVEVLNQIEELVDASSTYAELVAYISVKVDIANRLAGAMIFIIGDDIGQLNEPTPLSKCDEALVRKHLAKQRALLAFYAVSSG